MRQDQLASELCESQEDRDRKRLQDEIAVSTTIITLLLLLSRNYEIK